MIFSHGDFLNAFALEVWAGDVPAEEVWVGDEKLPVSSQEPCSWI